MVITIQLRLYLLFECHCTHVTLCVAEFFCCVCHAHPSPVSPCCYYYDLSSFPMICLCVFRISVAWGNELPALSWCLSVDDYSFFSQDTGGARPKIRFECEGQELKCILALKKTDILKFFFMVNFQFSPFLRHGFESVPVFYVIVLSRVSFYSLPPPNLEKFLKHIRAPFKFCFW